MPALLPPGAPRGFHGQYGEVEDLSDLERAFRSSVGGSFLAGVGIGVAALDAKCYGALLGCLVGLWLNDWAVVSRRRLIAEDL